MLRMKAAASVSGSLLVLLAGACSAPKVDFSQIKQPARATELDAYNPFVGSWTWEAKLLNAEGADADWNGTAVWKWSLDNRCLIGDIHSKSSRAEFMATGIWSWHPTKKRYMWWMFNNWGFPQDGTATYDAASKSWNMTYTSVGLDGTKSHGRYHMTVVDDNTLSWEMTEWADALHTIEKMTMKGTYHRQK